MSMRHLPQGGASGDTVVVNDIRSIQAYVSRCQPFNGIAYRRVHGKF